MQNPSILARMQSNQLGNKVKELVSEHLLDSVELYAYGIQIGDIFREIKFRYSLKLSKSVIRRGLISDL